MRSSSSRSRRRMRSSSSCSARRRSAACASTSARADGERLLERLARARRAGAGAPRAAPRSRPRAGPRRPRSAASASETSCFCRCASSAMRELRRLGRAVEVLRPAGEPLLDLRLRRGQRFGERGGDVALALGELAPVLLRELALFLDEQRDRVGARARERALELGGAVLGFCSTSARRRACASARCASICSARRARARSASARRRGERAAGEAAGGDRELARVRVAEREAEPGGDRGAELERGQRDERGARQEAQRGAGERERGDTDSGGEDDVEGGRQRHRPMVGRSAGPGQQERPGQQRQRGGEQLRAPASAGLRAPLGSPRLPARDAHLGRERPLREAREDRERRRERPPRRASARPRRSTP